MTAGHGMLTHCCPDHLTMQKLVERALPGGFPATALFTFLALGEGRGWVSALQREGLERPQLGLPRGGGESWGVSEPASQEPVSCHPISPSFPSLLANPPWSQMGPNVEKARKSGRRPQFPPLVWTGTAP